LIIPAAFSKIILSWEALLRKGFQRDVDGLRRFGQVLAGIRRAGQDLLNAGVFEQRVHVAYRQVELVKRAGHVPACSHLLFQVRGERSHVIEGCLQRL
jgi:hypothetical protein